MIVSVMDFSYCSSFENQDYRECSCFRAFGCFCCPEYTLHTWSESVLEVGKKYWSSSENFLSEMYLEGLSQKYPLVAEVDDLPY